MLPLKKMEKIMPKLIILVGPPGSGKSTYARAMIGQDGNYGASMIYVNQDSQGRDGHMDIFLKAVYAGKDVVVDRMNFNKQQRITYLDIAKLKGYETQIIVLHQPYAVCLERMRNRFGKHETINEEKDARHALQTFFSKYERPEISEADKVEFVYPEGQKPLAVYADLDGTLCIEHHRRHYVRPPANTLVGPTGEMVSVLGQYDAVDITQPLPVFKKNWKAFFDGIPYDTVNAPVLDILNRFSQTHPIVFCTGRSYDAYTPTVEWLSKHVNFAYALYMRGKNDYRQGCIIKEVLLDFELLTRYQIYFCLEDRDQVVQMLRRRGLTVLQVADGDF